MRLPVGIVPLYKEINGFRVEWHATAEVAAAQPLRGSINLLPLARVFGSWAGAASHPNNHVYQPIRPFDLFVPEACAAFYLPEGVTDSTVFFHYFGEGSVDTRYNFTEYMERLLISRGFWYWIQALGEETSVNPEAEAFRQLAPTLFSDFDPAMFQPRT